MFGVRRNGTISGLFSPSPLSKRQSKSQLMFSAFVVSISIFSVWRSPSPSEKNRLEVMGEDLRYNKVIDVKKIRKARGEKKRTRWSDDIKSRINEHHRKIEEGSELGRAEGMRER